MKNIAIYGAGGLGKEVACLIRKINEEEPVWNLIGFFDDGKPLGLPISHYGKVLGDINTLNAWSESLAIVIAIGTPTLVESIVQKIENPHIEFPNLIYPNLRFADYETFSLGKGNIIKQECSFSCDIALGNFNLFNGGVKLGHDIKIGSFNMFMPDTRISGEVVIGNTNFFGVGSIVLQRIKIGRQVRLGAASVLMTKPQDSELYMGNPAKLLKL